MPVVIQRDEDGQSHGCLSRSDGHDEKDEDEPVKLVELAGVSDKRQIAAFTINSPSRT